MTKGITYFIKKVNDEKIIFYNNCIQNQQKNMRSIPSNSG